MSLILQQAIFTQQIAGLHTNKLLTAGEVNENV